MATSGEMLRATRLAAAVDMSGAGYQYRFMKISANDTVTRAAASSDLSIGVLQNAPKLGEAVELAYNGETKVEAGGTVTAGQEIMADTQGRAVTAATTGNRAIGVAVNGGAVGELITVLLGVTPRLIP